MINQADSNITAHMYVAEAIADNKLISPKQIGRIFIKAIQDNQKNILNDGSLATVAYLLLEIYTTPKDVFEADQILGGLLHDTQELINLDGIKKLELKKELLQFKNKTL